MDKEIFNAFEKRLDRVEKLILQEDKVNVVCRNADIEEAMWRQLLYQNGKIFLLRSAGIQRVELITNNNWLILKDVPMKAYDYINSKDIMERKFAKRFLEEEYRKRNEKK